MFLAPDGTFTYLPAAGHVGTDSAIYTLMDEDGNTDTASILIENNWAITVTVPLTETVEAGSNIWFIDNSSETPGDGTLARPYTSIAQLNQVNGLPGEEHPEAGDLFFLYTSENPYTGPINLLSAQSLIGQGASENLEDIVGANLVAHSSRLPSSTIAKPEIQAPGTAINLDRDNTLRGFNIGDTVDYGIFGSGELGTTTISDMSIFGSGGILSIEGTAPTSPLTASRLNAEFDRLESTGSTQEHPLNIINMAGNFFANDLGISDTGGDSSSVFIDNSSADFLFGSIDINQTPKHGISLSDLSGSFTVQGKGTDCPGVEDGADDREEFEDCNGGTVQNSGLSGIIAINVQDFNINAMNFIDNPQAGVTLVYFEDGSTDAVIQHSTVSGGDFGILVDMPGSVTASLKATGNNLSAAKNGVDLRVRNNSKLSAGFTGSSIVSSDLAIVALVAQNGQAAVDVEDSTLSGIRGGFFGDASNDSVLAPTFKNNFFSSQTGVTIQNVGAQTVGRDSSVISYNFEGNEVKDFSNGTVHTSTGNSSASLNILANTVNRGTASSPSSSVIVQTSSEDAVVCAQVANNGGDMPFGVFSRQQVGSSFQLQNLEPATGASRQQVTTYFTDQNSFTGSAFVQPEDDMFVNAYRGVQECVFLPVNFK